MYQIGQFMPAVESLYLCHRRKEHGRYGVGDGGGKENTRQRHTGQDTVSAERLGQRHAKSLQFNRDRYCLYTLQEIQQYTACRKRYGEGKQFAGMPETSVKRYS